ncbi:MAG: 50S ribosomal protein L11 methyltransferase [Rhodospirillales bacterium]|nr:50S ribosomal protein L11 methyltransferase [Rhodospirillales bacterium]
MKPRAPVWRIEVMTTAAAQPALARAIEDDCDALMAFEVTPGGPWRLEGLTMDEPDPAAIHAQLARAADDIGLPAPAAKIERLPEIDWVAENQRSFPPLRVGRFFVYGSHYKGAKPPGAAAIELDAGIAFGSGEHATTRGCLLAIERLSGRRRIGRALDLGCGSGILAIALARRSAARVLAADIDRDAVHMTRENARRNQVAGRVTVRWSDGIARLPRRRGYDLILANILARPLRRLARDLSRAAARGGYVVLSGLLADQEVGVRTAYRARGLAFIGRIALAGWHTLIFRRRP